MERAAEVDLEVWNERRGRKPLVIRGARQVGKTHLVESFGRRRFENVVKLDLERDPGLAELFKPADPAAVIRLIELKSNAPVKPGRTLLFLDEVQAAPHVFARLRDFAEDLPSLHVVAAGSLLDFMLGDHAFSMPVGRISYLHLEPMTFEEFLAAVGSENLAEFLRRVKPSEEIHASLHETLLDHVRTFLMVGGMPAAVRSWRESRSWSDVRQVQRDLVATFRDDFARYRRRVDPDDLRHVFDAFPRLVGRKFVAAQVNRERRASPLKDAFDLLCLARVATPVRRSASSGVPLGAQVHEDYSKVCLLDVGLYTAMCGLEALDVHLGSDLTLVNEGQLAEQFVGQELRAARPAHQEPGLFCWVREQRTSNAEVDFVVQHGSKIVPVEVKAGATGRLRSLHVFLREKRRRLGVRISGLPLSLTDNHTSLPDGDPFRFRLLSVPLYLTGQVPRLISEC